MNLRRCVITIWVTIICAFSTTIVAQTSGVNPTIGFVGEIPSELTWEELQAGYPIRVQNIGSSELEAIGFRIRVAGTIKTQRYNIKKCENSESTKKPCLISYEIFVAGLNGKTEIISLVCEYRKGKFKSYLPPCLTLYEVPRNQSNTFMLRAIGEQPSKSFKLFVLVNESKGQFPISKQIMIKVPTTPPSSEMQTKVFAQNKTITINVLCSLFNLFNSYCIERGNLIVQYDQMGEIQTRFALESSDGFNRNLFVDINPCEKGKKHLVISFPVSQEPTSIPTQEKNPEAVKTLESYCIDNAITEPEFPQDSLLGLQPGIYKANLDKIVGPDGKPLSLTVQIRHPYWLALLPALAGIILVTVLKRRLGVIFPTQALLFKIHSTSKQYLEYVNSTTLTNNFNYEIGDALKIQAKYLEERVRQVRASTTLVIDNGNEDYKKLGADVTAFSLFPNQWYDLIKSLQSLKDKKRALEQAVKTQNPPDQKLTDLLQELHVCYVGTAISSENAQAAHQEASKHFVVAQRLAEMTLILLVQRSIKWGTVQPKLEAWEPISLAANSTLPQTQKKSWFKEFFDKIKIPSFLQSKKRRVKSQTSILGWKFNTTTWYEFVIPIVGLTIAAYFEIYANYPSWGSTSDYVKSFSWGLVTNAVTQVFFTAIERLPLGKLFGGQS